jgi:hypothetical protein
MRDIVRSGIISVTVGGGGAGGVPSRCRTRGRRKQSTHYRRAMCAAPSGPRPLPHDGGGGSPLHARALRGPGMSHRKRRTTT